MKRQLRVLHVGNGAAFKIRAIVDAQRARGHDVHMVPIPPSPPAMNGTVWHQLPASSLPGQAKVLARMLTLRRLAHRLQPDIVHAHNAWGPGWYGAATGRHPFVLHAYGGDFLPEQTAGRPATQRALTAWACRAADQIVVTGEHMVAASRSFGINPARVTVLPRGVDLARYRPGLDASPLRRRLGLDDARPVLFSPRYQVDESLYNLDIVLEAFAEVRRHLPKAVCLQMFGAGRPAGIAALKALASRYDLGASYQLVPQVDNTEMPLFYNCADVTISVPSSDGFPVTVLEASACGCPLIVSDLPYCREWFMRGENGLVVPSRDAGALARAILELWLAPDLRRRFAEAGRALVETRADYAKCMDRLELLYFDLLERRQISSREPG